MTIKFLTTYGKWSAGQLATLDAATETALVAAKQATTDLTGGTAYVEPPAGRPYVDATGALPAADLTAADVARVRAGADPRTASAASLPALMSAIRAYDDAAPSPLRVMSLGSSVMVGATLPDPTTQAAVARLAAGLNAALNPLGNLTFVATNGGVNGTCIVSALNGDADYADAVTAAGGPAKIGLIGYGMNDGQPASYHSGQTFPANYTKMCELIERIRGDGGDAVVMTSPHPHSTRNPWATLPPSVAYPPGGVQIPGPTYAASVVTADFLGNGKPVPASYRHARVNEAYRQAAFDMGAPLLDVERYWFEALAEYTEDQLFNPGEYAHPNLLGHQLSYWRAIDDFCVQLRFGRSAPQRSARLTDQTKRKPNTTTHTGTALASDADLSFYAQANATYSIECECYYSVPTGADLKIGIALPSGAAGRMGIHGAERDTPTNLGASSVTVAGNTLFAGGTGAEAVAKITATVTTGATAGLVAMQFAQFVATGTNTIFAGSLMRVRRVD